MSPPLRVLLYSLSSGPKHTQLSGLSDFLSRSRDLVTLLFIPFVADAMILLVLQRHFMSQHLPFHYTKFYHSSLQSSLLSEDESPDGQDLQNLNLKWEEL